MFYDPEIKGGKMKGYLIAATGLFVVALSLNNSVPAQEQQMDMSVAPENVIDGSTHPEKITDRDAYKMFLLSVSLKDSSDSELARQKATFSPLNLTDEQQTIASQIVADFAAEVQAVNAAWDAAAQVSNPTPSDEAAYRKQIRGIVDEAMAKFELGLGGEKSRVLHGFIQDEKKNM